MDLPKKFANAGKSQENPTLVFGLALLAYSILDCLPASTA